MKRAFFVLGIMMIATNALAQVDSLLNVQKNLIKNEKRLQVVLDSLQSVLTTARNEFGQTNSDAVATEIIRLENQIYDVRSNLSKLGAGLAQNEALLAKNGYVEKKSNTNDPAENTYLLKNTYFVNNVSKKDLSIMSLNNDKELINLVGKSSELYNKLTQLKELYEAAQTQEEVNVMMMQARDLKQNIAQIDLNMQKIWNEFYHKKIDNYIVLLDKINNVSRNNLELIDQLNREVIQNEMSLSASLAPTVAILPYQRNLVLGYESVLAEELRLGKAIDSIAKVKVNKWAVSKFEDIQFPYRSVVVFGDITIGNQYPYSDLEEVPMLKLPTTGLHYAIQVALVNGKASSLSIFKGAQPLQQEDVAGGKKRYVLGGFRTYEAASKAVKECLKFGFKYPVAVAWIDGKSVSLQTAQAYQKANPVEEFAQGGYNVIVATKDSGFAAKLKEIVDVHAKGKTITRVNQNGEFIYNVSSFTTPEEAQVFAQILRTQFPENDVDVKSADLQ